MKKTLIIYNQNSGRRRHLSLLSTIKKNLPRSKYQLTFKNFENFVDDDDLEKKFNYDLVIVAGGDGTIRLVSSFLMKNNLQVPIGIIPTGSANVLAQSLYIPRSISQALEIINEGYIDYLDVGFINNREYFLEAFSIGYLTERIVGAEQKLKRSFGFVGYLMSFLMNRKIPQYIFKFSVDGQEYSRRGNSLFIVNTSRLFGFEPKRTTDLKDGKFELTLATNKNFIGFVEATYYYYFHDSPPRHLSILEGSNFKIKLNKNSQIQIDGDYFDTKEDSLEIKILQKKLAVIKNAHHKQDK